MLNELLLLSGNDIPFIQAQINIHQPTIKEIGYIGEESFYSGCEILTFSKDILKEEDRISLENKTNFEILMSILMDKNPVLRKNRVDASMLFALIFPDYQIRYSFKEIQLIKEDEIHSINIQNFENFKEILNAMFCLKTSFKNETNADFNPAGELSRKIAEKLKKGRAKVNQLKGPQKIAILSRYISILSVGERKNINELLNYTVYQLFDEFQRFELKEEFDIYVKAKMAGARDLKEVDNWKKDIHP